MHEFGGFAYDDATGVLSRKGMRIPLQRQPGRVLSYFLEHPGRVISRGELARHVWPDDHHVDFNQGLNYCVRQVRRALDDGAAQPRFVETVPQQGYRWIPQVPPRLVAAATSSPMSVWWRRHVSIGSAAAVSLACCVLSAGGFYWLGARGDGRPGAAASAPSEHLRAALGALHVLSHAIVEPTRRAEAGPAVETLWRVVASHADVGRGGPPR